MKGLAPAQSKCPCCGNDRVKLFYDAPSVPVNSVLLLPTREQALALPMGDIRLGFCEGCGFIYNTTFDRRLVQYSTSCEETQGFSPFFRAWHEDLARRLIDRYSLRSKKIVEIGCGKGEFLALLCDLGGNYGVGFDPAYVRERTAQASTGRVDFINDVYSEKYNTINGEFLCCKMTLEHIENAIDFVRMVRRQLRNEDDSCVFFQVPDVLRLLEEGAFWDIYYEHCSYFSIGSLARLFRAAGFELLALGREYHDQYLTIEARAGDGNIPFEEENDLDNLKNLVKSFMARVPVRIAEWRRQLEEFRQKRCRTVIWGAGSKGVAFLATVDVPGAVEYVVDINPNMSGHYTAKTGLKIVSPSFLNKYRPDVVIVMNPVYEQEITAELAARGISAQVITI